MLRNYRRLLVALGAALFAAAPAALHAQQSGQPVRGDVDGDGQVTAADARIVSDFLVGRPVPGGVDIRLRADVNGDGRVTAADAAIIRAAAAGRNVGRFPVGQAIPDAALAVLQCTGSVRRMTVECRNPGAPATGARTDIIVGGQNVNVKLASANVQQVAPDTLQFTVTIQNLLAQAMAADSGTGAASANGLRIFFHSGPTVTSGPGSVTVANPDGIGTFLAANQRYFQYSGADLGGDGVLSQNEVSSPRTWKLQITGSEPEYEFMLYVSAPMQFPFGWVDVYPPSHAPSPTAVYADTMQVGSTLQLQDTVRNLFGSVIPGAPVTWSNTANGHATVNSSGLVSAVSPGVDTVIATAGPRKGRVQIVVANVSADSTTITAVPTNIAANDTSLITVQVRDEFGHNITSGGATVSLTTDLGTLVGATTGTTVNAVDNGNGTYTAKLTGTTTGTATVTGTLNAVPIPDNATVTIGAGAVNNFVVEAAAGGNIPDQLVNTPFNVKVTARDAYNNTATSFTGTVGFTSTPGGGISAGAGPSAAFTAGVLSSHAITFGTTGSFTLTATRTGGSEAGTSNSFQVQAPPTAVNDGPTPTSVPGDPYHTAFNTTFNLPTLGLMANDTRGFPLATVVSFGADSLGGTVTSHAAGSTVNPLPGHANGALTVNADGSVAFTPPTGFTGLYVFKYRISNVRGTSDAQVTIAVGVRPAVNNDTYATNLLGNVPINTATSTQFNVTTNDAGDAKVLELGTATNGTAVLSPTGTFTFTPNAGYTGPASFTYTLKNGFGTTAAATVSMTVSGIAWFIDKGAGAGDGRFGTPFNDLSTAFAAGTKPQANQPIFLYHDPTSYTGGVTLLAGQRLVGEGATGTFAAAMGVTWPADAGPQPAVGGTSPTVLSGLTLGSGNTLQGFNLGGAGTLSGNNFGTLTVSEVGINTTGQALNLTTGTIAGGFSGLISTGGTNNVLLSSVSTTGTATMGASGNALSGATGDGVVITNGGGSFTFPGDVSNGSSFAVNVNTKSGGTATFSGNINPGGAARGISVTNNTGGTVAFSGGTKAISSGTASGVTLTGNSGAIIQFTGGGLAIATTTGTPFTATGGGTVEVTGSGNTITATGAAANAVNLNGITLGASGMSFASVTASGTTTGSAFSATSVGGGSFTAAALTVAATTGGTSRGMALTTNSASFTFTTASINNTGGEGIYLNGNTGAVAVNGGTVGNTTSTAGDALAVSGGNAGITVAASLTKSTAGRIANIASHTAGTVTVSGALSCTSACTGILANANSGGTIDFSNGTKTLNTGTNGAVSLTSNTGATINFTGGGLALTTSTGTAFSATGGGTVNVTGSNNTVSTSGGVGVNIQNTTIGASNATFRSVAKSTGSNFGIRLENTGASGGLKVTGDGSTANSGGILVQSATTAADSAGVTLTGTTGLDLQLMRVSITTGTGASGIVATNLTGTNQVGRTSIDYNNTAPGGAIHGAYGVRLVQNSSNATLTLDGVSIANKLDGTTAGSLSAGGSVTVDFNVIDSNTGDSFNSNVSGMFGSGWVISSGDTGGSTGTVNATIANTRFMNAAANGTNNLELGANASSTMNYKIRNNTFSAVANASFIAGIMNLQTFDTAVMGGSTAWDSISGNTITNSGTSSAVADLGYIGIRVALQSASATTHRMVIHNNQITDLWRQGVLVSTRQNATGNIKVVNNVIGTSGAPVGQSNRRGLETDLQDNSVMNLEATGNSFYNSGTSDSNAAMGLRVGTNSGSATLNATVLSNNIANSSAGTTARFRAESAATGTGTLCLDLRTNSLDAAAKNFGLTQSGGTFRVEGAGTGAVSNASIQSANTVGGGNVSGTINYNNSANCTQPPI